MPPSNGARGTSPGGDFLGYGRWHLSTKAPFFYIGHGDQYDPSIKGRPNPYSDDPVLEPPPQKGPWVGYTEMTKREKARAMRMKEWEEGVERRLRLAKEQAEMGKGWEERVMNAEKGVAGIDGETPVGKDRTIVGEDETILGDERKLIGDK